MNPQEPPAGDTEIVISSLRIWRLADRDGAERWAASMPVSEGRFPRLFIGRSPYEAFGLAILVGRGLYPRPSASEPQK